MKLNHWFIYSSALISNKRQ